MTVPRRATRTLALLLVLTAASGASTPANADEGRLSGDNLLEARSGNFPFVTPKDRTDLYDQLNLSYDTDRLRVGLRFELQENSEEQLTYTKVTQRWAEWRDEHATLRVGHMYTLLGRGLVHRSFELPGVVLDFDQARQRSRHTPSRDLDGVQLRASAGPFEALAFSGQPNSGYTPGSEPESYPRTEGQLTGGQIAAAAARGLRAGATWARHDASGRQEDYGSGFAEFDPTRWLPSAGVRLPLYLEYATLNATPGDWLRFRTGDDAPHALYASANIEAGAVAVSCEWKDYEGFRNGINDPPSLVREQSWTLLNRNTHVLNAGREEGYQIEGTWTPTPWAAITLNRSGAEGLAGHYQETYVEWHAGSAVPGAWEATLAFDAGRDGVLLPDQHTWCASVAAELRPGWSAAGAFERLSGRNAVNRFADHAATLTLSRAETGSAAITWERSTDVLQEDPERPGRPRHFVAGTFSARLSARQSAALFVGTRRGGRACTAGTCYEVEPFRGAELRVTSRF